MEVLVKKGFYTTTVYLDNQAMCEPDNNSQTATASVMRPISSVFRAFSWVISQFLLLLSEFSLMPNFFRSNDHLSQAFTTTFKPSDGRYPCRAQSKFYLANTDRKGAESAALLKENYSERPCKQNAAQCAVKVYASWVEGTNLLLVVIRQNSQSSCYDEMQCPMSTPFTVPFGFRKVEVDPTAAAEDAAGPTAQELKCAATLPRQRKNVVQCLRDEYHMDEHEMPCSTSLRTTADISLFSLYALCTCVLVRLLNGP
jgi:hypothetical protein